MIRNSSGLFRGPIALYICMLPLPLSLVDTMYMDCCGTTVCSGCMFENKRVVQERNMKKVKRNQAEIERCCLFCRESFRSMGKVEKLERRMEADDAKAFDLLGDILLTGRDTSKDARRGMKLLFRAAELGSASACTRIGCGYLSSENGLEKDEAQARKYLEMAAKREGATGWSALGTMEYKDGNNGLAYKHWSICAAAGHQFSLDYVRGLQRGSC